MRDPYRHYDYTDPYNETPQRHRKKRRRRNTGGGCFSVFLCILFLTAVLFIGLGRYYNRSPLTIVNYVVSYYSEQLGIGDLISSLPEPLKTLLKGDVSLPKADNPTPDNKPAESSSEGEVIPPSEETDVSKETQDNTGIIKDLQESLDARFGDTGDITDESQAGYYCYNLLSDKGKTVYREILDSITNRKERAVSTLDSEELNTVYNYVMSDHPEIFYTSGIHYSVESINGVVTSITVKGQYTLSEEEVSSYKASLTEVIGNLLAEVPGFKDGTSTDDYTKIKYLYDHIVNTTDYEEGADENQNIISVLLYHRSVCNGYAKTLQYLSQLMGIPSILVTGYAENGPHAWNVILMDGGWYQIDVTFGESTVSTEDSATSFINYSYFGLTDDEMYVNHTPDANIPVPTCSSYNDNYYIYTGNYFSSSDIETIGSKISSAQNNGENLVQFRTANADIMSEVTNKLFTEHKIYNYLENVSSCTYVLNASKDTIVIIF
ncbi:Transglutaminase-like superfamily protein [Oribacterium sp. KHPX15]|uniref:transglutaminase domain-containing protein n=1 Tax=Oribacterium sp. KHPX15 TaxID=1855342 RepID=UPI00089B4EAB|nr:transglutaminase domain-containing protein [Oribacterium sp. KHPX15]SEA22208.1 Transglutaminase-like superfamily protein [Oribacterium sp. KHPX15]